MIRRKSGPQRLLTNRSILIALIAFAAVVAAVFGFSTAGSFGKAGSPENAAGDWLSADAGTSATPSAEGVEGEAGDTWADAVAGATPLGGEFGEGLIADASTAASPLAGNVGIPGAPGSGAAPDAETGATPGGGYIEPSPAPGVDPSVPPDTNTGASPAPEPTPTPDPATPPPDTTTGPTPPAPTPTPTPDPATPPPDTETGASPPAPTPTPDPTKPPEDDEEDDEEDEFEKDSLSLLSPGLVDVWLGGGMMGLVIVELRRRRRL